MIPDDPLYATICTLGAIAGITAIEIIALLLGVNGKVLSLTIALIAGLGGFFLGAL